MSIITYCSSKINFYLEIFGKHCEQYHNIISFFIPVNWFDKMVFTPIKGDKVLFASNDSFLTEQCFDSLTVGQAVKYLKPYQKIQQSYQIFLDKTVPYNAGLGIASSNAAQVLYTLNQLWDCQLSVEQLIMIGRKIGSDCHFFLKKPYGIYKEEKRELKYIGKKPLKFPLWILNPLEYRSHTNQAFMKIQEQQLYHFNDELAHRIENFFCTWDYNLLPTVIQNTFIEVLPNMHAIFGELELYAKIYGFKIGLSGSGSSLFILFKDFSQEKAFQEKKYSWLKKKFDFYFTIL